MVVRTSLTRALWQLLMLGCVLGLAARTRAQDIHECRDTRNACDARILEICPGGADVIDEQSLLPDEEHVARYQTVFRCRPAPAAQPQPVAPAAPEDLRVPERLELARLRSSVMDVQARRPGVGTPTTLLCIGVPLAALFTPLMVMQIGYAQGSGDIIFAASGHRALAGMFGTVAFAGFGMAVGGIVWLARRVHARRALDRELEELNQRIDKLASSLEVAYLPTTRTLMLSLRF